MGPMNYPLVKRLQFANWRKSPFFMGKSTISCHFQSQKLSTKALRFHAIRQKPDTTKSGKPGNLESKKWAIPAIPQRKTDGM